MLGKIQLRLKFGNCYTVFGGPFRQCPNHMVGVKMAKEIDLPCDINIPTPDFSTPPEKELAEGLEQAIKAILGGEAVYVGCFAGKGRTGLFLSLLAKAFGEQKPVEYVREHYYSHAVETDEQYQFVMNYKFSRKIVWGIRFSNWLGYFKPRGSLTYAK